MIAISESLRRAPRFSIDLLSAGTIAPADLARLAGFVPAMRWHFFASMTSRAGERDHFGHPMSIAFCRDMDFSLLSRLAEHAVRVSAGKDVDLTLEPTTSNGRGLPVHMSPVRQLNNL